MHANAYLPVLGPPAKINFATCICVCSSFVLISRRAATIGVYLLINKISGRGKESRVTKFKRAHVYVIRTVYNVIFYRLKLCFRSLTVNGRSVLDYINYLDHELSINKNVN